jgi:osmotically inducible protein OsmC
MPTRTAEAVWTGNITEGKGILKTESGVLADKPYDWKSRSAEGPNTNPEELLGAAHAGCFSMALSGALGKAGFTPTRVHTTAKVTFEKQGEGFAITKIDLTNESQIPNIDEAKFQELANGAKAGCPVSKALTGTTISLNAKLVK